MNDYNNEAGSFPSHSPESPSPVQTKPSRVKRHIFLKIIAGLLCCAVISAGSIGGFVWMINEGYVTVTSPQSPSSPSLEELPNSDTETSVPAISIPPKTPSVSGDGMSLQEIASTVTPSVVCIQNFQRSAFSGNLSMVGEGSGIIMDRDGYIITNEHVVHGASQLSVILYDGTSYDAALIGSDRASDLALIKIDAEDLHPAAFGVASDLSVGDELIAIGNPGGVALSSTVTFGHVSALNRSVKTNDGYVINCIQTDAAINPGNSGGALVNIYGEVVGINSSKIAATEYEGLGFAISIDEATPILTELKEHGSVTDRATLGIEYQLLSSSTANYYGLPVGIYVSSIRTKEASESGLRRGDVITEIDGVSASSSALFSASLSNKKPGDTVILTVYRSSIKKTGTVTMKLSSNEFSLSY